MILNDFFCEGTVVTDLPPGIKALNDVFGGAKRFSTPDMNVWSTFVKTDLFDDEGNKLFSQEKNDNFNGRQNPVRHIVYLGETFGLDDHGYLLNLEGDQAYGGFFKKETPVLEYKGNYYLASEGSSIFGVGLGPNNIFCKNRMYDCVEDIFRDELAEDDISLLRSVRGKIAQGILSPHYVHLVNEELFTNLKEAITEGDAHLLLESLDYQLDHDAFEVKR